MKSLRKRNATLCAILDMKLFNKDIIDTVADDKKTLQVLDQRLVLQNISQHCPKKQKLRVSTIFTSHNAHDLF